MSDEKRNLLMTVYGTANEAGVQGVMKFASDIKDQYGEDGVKAAEKWLDSIDATEIFDTESDPQKTASEFSEEYGIDQDTFNSLDLQGRIIAHAVMDEMGQRDKLAEHVRQSLHDRFEQEVLSR